MSKLLRELYDELMYEMSNISSRYTGLSQNLEVWLRTDEKNHGHNRYRVKIKKDKIWAGIFTVSSNPTLINPLKNTLTSNDQKQILNWIKKNSTLIISLIDGKLDTIEFCMELQRHLNENSDQKLDNDTIAF